MKHGAIVIVAENGNEAEAPHDRAYSMIRSLIGENCVIGKTELGAPFLEGDGRFVSVSHSSSITACALSDVPVGIDTEPCGRKIPPAVVEKITATADSDPVIGWTMTESSLKLFGHGLDRIRNCDEFVRSSVHKVRMINGNVITVATKKSDGPVTVLFVTAPKEKSE